MHLITPAKTILPMTFLQKSGSKEIQSSTTGTLAAPDKYTYAPSAGQFVHLTRLQIFLLDNTQWPDSPGFGDYASNLTNGLDIGIFYGGYGSLSFMANAIYITATQLFYEGPLSHPDEVNASMLYGSFTQDDRAILACLSFAKDGKSFKYEFD